MMTKKLPPLELQTKPLLTTEEAAYYMNRKVQTLRIWACKKSGPLTPIHMGGPLRHNAAISGAKHPID